MSERADGGQRSFAELQGEVWQMELDHFVTHEDESPYYFAWRMVCEAGELGNTLNKLVAYKKGSRNVLLEDLKKEFGDILVFICLAASQLDIDLQQCLETVIRRNKQRVELGYYGNSQKERGKL